MNYSERLLIALALVATTPACEKGKGLLGSSNKSSQQAVQAPALGVLTAAPQPAELLTNGKDAPDFAGITHLGATARLYPLLKKPVLLLFYPEDGLHQAGGTVKLVEERWLELQPKLSVVLAIVGNGSAELAAYASATQAPFLFLADEDDAIRRAYGVRAPSLTLTAVVVGVHHDVIYAEPDFAQQATPVERLLSVLTP